MRTCCARRAKFRSVVEHALTSRVSYDVKITRRNLRHVFEIERIAIGSIRVHFAYKSRPQLTVVWLRDVTLGPVISDAI